MTSRMPAQTPQSSRQALTQPRVILAGGSLAVAWSGAVWLYAPQVIGLTLVVLLGVYGLFAVLLLRTDDMDKDAAVRIRGRRIGAIGLINVSGCALALWSSHAVMFYWLVLPISFAISLRLSLEITRERTTGDGVVALLRSAVAWTTRGLLVAVVERLRHTVLVKTALGRGRPRSRIPYEHVERVMVVSHSHIGDAIMQTPAVTLIASALPAARIVVLTNSSTDAVFRDNPFVSERIRCLPLHGHYPTFEEFRRLFGLRRAGPTLCVLDFSASQTMGKWFAWIAGPVYVVADGSVTPELNFLVDETISTSDLSHYVDRNAAVVCRSSLGVAQSLEGVPNLTPILARESPEVRVAADSLCAMGISASALLIGFVVGSAAGGIALSKRWPVERFAVLARRLKSKVADAQILAFKGPEERDLDYRALQEAGCHIVEGKSLLEVAGIVARCGLMVGNDSGLGHVAACMGLPVVTIFGPTDWNLVKPYSPTSLAVRQEGCPPCFGGQELAYCGGARPCILGVTVDQVQNATLSLLSRASEDELLSI